MIEEDTIRLLRECDAGIKMGIESIDDVLKYVYSNELRNMLVQSKNEHEELKKETENALEKYQDEGKNPNPIVKGMSWMKTNMRLIVNESDETIADLMTDGCNMGIKSLSKYLNEYEAADELSKDIVKKVINIEQQLITNIRPYL